MDPSVTRLFQRENIRELREAVNSVLDIFDLVIQSDLKGKLYWTHDDILNKLECVEKDKWIDIRIKFLDEVNTNTESEDLSNDPCKLFVDICNHIETCRQDLVDTINGADERYKDKLIEVQLIKDEHYKASQDIIELKLQTNRDRSEINKLKSRQEYLQQSLENKQQYINQLQRAETVQLWDKEKNRLLEAVNKREHELEHELADLKMENESMQRRLSKKISIADDKHKMLKLKQEIAQRTDNGNETEKLKRQIFLLEKDIVTREKELFEQGKYTIGIMAGLKRDVKIMIEKASIKKQTPRDTIRKMSSKGKPDTEKPGHVKDLENLHEILSKSHMAVTQGKLSLLRADLPDHYIATETELKNLPGRWISSNKQINTDTRLEPLKQTDTHLPSFLRDNHLRKEPLQSITKHATLFGDHQNSHPDLVNHQTGAVNKSTLTKHFPSMSPRNVKEHWEKFCKFDTNGDRSLDLEELMSAMTSTIGQQFTAAQIWDAVAEVDLDNSLTIDFYEYVKIADMIKKNSGRSDVFRSALVEKEGRTISKTCIIQ